MAKRVKTIALFCGVYALSFFGAALVTQGGSQPETEAVGALSYENADAPYYGEASTPVVYILREHEGNICVYYKNYDGIPAIITDISVENLRSVDRKMIEAGIEVSTKEEVLKLLEDFGS